MLLTSVFVCSAFITATWTVLKVLVPEEQTSILCVFVCTKYNMVYVAEKSGLFFSAVISMSDYVFGDNFQCLHFSSAVLLFQLKVDFCQKSTSDGKTSGNFVAYKLEFHFT